MQQRIVNEIDGVRESPKEKPATQRITGKGVPQ